MGEIGDSSRTPETYFDTDRHPEHEDCRPMCFHINSLTAFPDAEWPNSSEESLPKKSAEAARSWLRIKGEIGDSSRTPETYFDTDRHPEHEDCRPMCFHINSLTAFPDAEWPNSSEESLPKKSAEAARSWLRIKGSGAVPDLVPDLPDLPPISPSSTTPTATAT